MVLSYRNGKEKNLSNVLQIDRVFTNVSHGKFASEKEMKSTFGKASTREVIEMILNDGELQVAELERSVESERIWNTITEFTAANCINPSTKRKYSIPIIDKAMRAVGFSVRYDWAWKRQALLLIKKLVQAQPIPIARAQSKVRITVPLDQMSAFIEQGFEILEREEHTSASIFTVLMDTSQLRTLYAMQALHGYSVCVIDSAVAAEGSGCIEDVNLLKQSSATQSEVIDEGEPHSACGYLSNRPINDRRENSKAQEISTLRSTQGPRTTIMAEKKRKPKKHDTHYVPLFENSVDDDLSTNLHKLSLSAQCKKS